MLRNSLIASLLFLGLFLTELAVPVQGAADISAGNGTKAVANISAGNGTKAVANISAGNGTKAVANISAGNGTKAGANISAGNGTKAGARIGELCTDKYCTDIKKGTCRGDLSPWAVSCKEVDDSLCGFLCFCCVPCSGTCGTGGSGTCKGTCSSTEEHIGTCPGRNCKCCRALKKCTATKCGLNNLYTCITSSQCLSSKRRPGICASGCQCCA
ncbi:keratin-associated protein 5-7-like [Macrobrachium nipponense]|uniref:keratin-associated protein 5-7-like n=1 Tax=Macrobrachium nipponense TaxID=159736 RepID=UPI0030C88AFF